MIASWITTALIFIAVFVVITIIHVWQQKDAKRSVSE